MFRRVLSVLLFTAFALSACADEASNNTITFKAPGVIKWNKSIETGRVSMVKSQQPMILFLTAPSCHYCEMMKQTTFAQQWIIGEINKKYTPVMINGRENKTVADKLKVRMFPATAFVHPSGRVVEVAYGYKSPNQFLKHMAVAQSKLKLEEKKLAKKDDAASKKVQ